MTNADRTVLALVAATCAGLATISDGWLRAVFVGLAVFAGLIMLAASPDTGS